MPPTSFVIHTYLGHRLCIVELWYQFVLSTRRATLKLTHRQTFIELIFCMIPLHNEHYILYNKYKKFELFCVIFCLKFPFATVVKITFPHAPKINNFCHVLHAPKVTHVMHVL